MTEWNAAEYAKLSGLQAAMAEQVLSLLRTRLRGDERILDVGCGNGKVTREIAGLVPNGSVVGVDASAKMVEFAKAASAEASAGGGAALKNLSFEVVDARHLMFREEFDLVVSFNALHWIAEEEQASALRGIYAALKPGGVAQLRMVPRGARKSLENMIEETAKSPRWKEYFLGVRDPYLHMTAEAYSVLAEECGFQIESVKVKDNTWDFGTLSAFAAFGTVTFVEWSQHILEMERPGFVADALANYKPLGGNDHTFRFYQMDVTARRPAQ
jgi:trans-aconitate 2-methyltransferase